MVVGFTTTCAIKPITTTVVRVPGENHRPAASHSQTLSHNVASSTPRHEWDSSSQL
jgi:hypothetical protein